MEHVAGSPDLVLRSGICVKLGRMSRNLSGTENQEERGAACVKDREAWLSQEMKES